MTRDLAVRDEQHYLLTVREVRDLAERCDTVEDAKSLADRATAAKVYAERAKLGGDMVNRAAAAKLWAERRAGELLAGLPKNTGARGIGTSALPPRQDTPPTLADLGVTEKQSSRYQALAEIPADDFAEAIEEVAEAGPVTAEAVKRTALGTLKSSESDEWYTPADYIEAARRVMGGIDLDPASCDAANEVVQADRYFTISDDGLAQPWAGRVFMNPPFGRDGSPAFVEKLLAEHDAGRVTEAVLLCAARLETAWFQPLFDHLLCFPNHRVRFWQPGRTPAPPFTPAFAYLGPLPDAFVNEFSAFGPVVRRVDGAAT